MPILALRKLRKITALYGIVSTFLVISAPFCHAQISSDAQTTSKPNAQDEQNRPPEYDPKEADSWRFNVGLGLVSQPTFSGSQEKRTMVIPQFSANYGRLMIGQMGVEGPNIGIGYSLIDTPQWRFGVGVGSTLININRGQNANQNSGLGTIPRTEDAALFASYRFGLFALNANVASDIGGHHEGTKASLGLMANFRITPRWSMSAGPSISWVNNDYAKTFYGVTSAQSAASGYATYQANSGINGVQFGVQSQYKLSKQWDVGARVGINQPKNAAVNSPIVDKGNKTNLGVSLNYHF